MNQHICLFANPTSLWLKWSRAFVKSSSQHPFNPISSNFPGGGFTPPPFLLPRALESPGRSPSSAPRCHLSAIQAIIIFSLFFQHHVISTFTRFPTKINGKSIPRVIRKTSNIFHRFCIECSSIWDSPEPHF